MKDLQVSGETSIENIKLFKDEFVFLFVEG
jgi:hypothetical protein